MKNFVSKDPILGKIIPANLITILLSIFIIFLNLSSLPPKIPLFYSRPWGNDQIASALNIFIIPGLSILVFLVNFKGSQILLKNEEKTLIAICCGFSFLFSLLGLITVFKIISLIT